MFWNQTITSERVIGFDCLVKVTIDCFSKLWGKEGKQQVFDSLWDLISFPYYSWNLQYLQFLPVY